MLSQHFFPFLPSLIFWRKWSNLATVVSYTYSTTTSRSTFTMNTISHERNSPSKISIHFPAIKKFLWNFKATYTSFCECEYQWADPEFLGSATKNAWDENHHPRSSPFSALPRCGTRRKSQIKAPAFGELFKRLYYIQKMACRLTIVFFV